MSLEKELKEWIDNASYEDLLRKWRFAPSGDKFFQGEIGIYYSEVMAKKKIKVGHDNAVAASKRIEW